MSRIVDTHMHLFRSDLPLAASRKYAPQYDATWPDFIAHATPFGVSGAVIVQPSFLGTDNAFLLKCLAEIGDAARGVAVIEAATPARELDRLHAGGVRGIRFNVLSHQDAPLPEPGEWKPVFDHIRPLGWHIELHISGAQIPPLLDWLEDEDLPLIVDHFGRPDAGAGATEPGFQHLASRGVNPNLYCKVSAPYRLGGAPAQPYFDALVATYTPDRLLWASDWPWTQHEGRHTYADCIRWRDEMLAGHAGAFARMNAAALKLFDFK